MTNKKINYYRTKKSFLPIRAMIFMTTLSFALTTSITYAQETATLDQTSPLVPSGLTNGDKFRLLFVTHNRTSSANPTTTAKANAYVQGRANSSLISAFSAANQTAVLRAFSSQFRALVSTATLDARDNTGTNTANGDTDAPIYWLNGEKVADNYADFYDSDGWDSNSPKNEHGADRSITVIFTGSDSDGTVKTDKGIDVTGATSTGNPEAAGSEIDKGSASASSLHRYYALSPVFTVGTPVNSPSISMTPIGDDGRINATELAAGVQITGTSSTIDDGQSISLAFSTTDIIDTSVTVTNDTWSYAIPSSQITSIGQIEVTVTASYYITATDRTINTERTFTIDTISPTLATPIPDQTATVGTDFSFTIPLDTFTGEESVILYTSSGESNGINFDSSALTWSGVGSSLTPGRVTITVTATDGAGNTPTTDEFNIDIAAATDLDTTAPAAPVATLGGDSGVSNSDRITNNRLIAITGAEVGTTFEYSLDSGTNWSNAIQGTVLLAAFGFGLPADLPQGSVTVIVRQTDAAGNVSASSAPLTFTYDVTGPLLTTSLNCSGCTNNFASVGDSIIYTFTSPEDIAQTGIEVKRVDNITPYTISSITARGFVATYVVTASSPNTTDFNFSIAGLTDIAGNLGFPGNLPANQQVTIDTNPFITTWNTEAGDPGSTTIKLPISGGAYDVDTNNDGTFDLTNQAGTSTITINFGTAGTKIIKVRPNPTNNTSKQLQINHFQAGTPQKLMRIDKWGGIVWASMQTAFHSCSNMTIADDAGVPDLTVATSTHGMFAEATNFTGDLSGWDVSNVADLSVMFAEATSFNSDLSSWNISSATNMRAMLRGASSFTTQNYNALLRGWSRLPSLQPNVTFGAPPTNYCDDGVAARDVLTNPPNNWGITGDSACTPPPDTIENTENYFISTWEAESGGEANLAKIPITGGNYDIDVDNDGSFDGVMDKKNVNGNPNGLTSVEFGSERRRTIRIRLSPTDDNPSTQLRMDHSILNAAPERLISIQKWGGIVWSSMQNAFKDCTSMTIADDAGVPDLSMVTNMDAMFSGATSLTGDLSSWNVSGVTSMANMFTNASSFTTQDYDALLIGWSSLPSLQNEVTFGAPPTNYCAGEAGRNTLTGAIADGGYNWTITGDTGKSCSDLLLSVDAFLQGPYTSSSMMSDGLREGTHIPTISPYGDENTIESERTVLDVEGTDAIVDWVEISLHNRNNIGMVISTTPALLQRDGDVVGLNGTADLVISGAVGNYYVSINHRNHIPVITAAAKSLSTTNTAIDFTNDLTIVTGGSNAMAEVEVKSDNSKVYALFSGDVNGNGQIQVDDYNAAIQDVGRGGYLTSDVDMNGELQVSDINFVLKTLGKGAQF